VAELDSLLDHIVKKLPARHGGSFLAEIIRRRGENPAGFKIQYPTDAGV